jgi:hypothetical protein
MKTIAKRHCYALSKATRTSPPRSPIDTIGRNTAVGVSGKEINSLESWTKEGCRSEEYFEPAPIVPLNAAGHQNASPSPPPEEVEHTPSEDKRSPKR